MKAVIRTLFTCFVLAFAFAAGSPPAQALSPNQAAGIVQQDDAKPLFTKVNSCRRCAELQCRGGRIACAPGCRCQDIRPGRGGGNSCRSCAEKQCRGLRIACPRGCSCREVFGGRR